jgi:hypothetical protein
MRYSPQRPEPEKPSGTESVQPCRALLSVMSGVVTLDKWSILAGVRFLLASIVAFNHLAEYVSLGHFRFIPMFGAFEAILGFLLISGYSIASSYVQQPRGFLYRRAKRIYPVYLVAIAATIVVTLTVGHGELPTLPALAVNALLESVAGGMVVLFYVTPDAGSGRTPARSSMGFIWLLFDLYRPEICAGHALLLGSGLWRQFAVAVVHLDRRSRSREA